MPLPPVQDGLPSLPNTDQDHLQQMHGQLTQMQEQQLDLQVHLQVTRDKLKEADDENTNLRVMATKLNMEVSSLRQSLEMSNQQRSELQIQLETATAQPKTSSRARLRGSAAQ